MTRRYKIKQWFKKHFTKDKVFSIICTLLIGLLVLLCVYFENKDIEEQKQKHSDITLEEDNINLNTSWTINADGNLVGDNLLSGMTHNSTARYSTAYYSNNNITFLDNIIYTFICYRNYNPEKVSSYYLNERLFDMVEGYTRYFLTNTTNIYIAQFTASGEASSNEIIIKNEADNTSSYYVNDLYNFMILQGAYTLDTIPTYEPYGVWYSETNYDLNGTLKYNEGMAEYQKTYYYFDNKTASVYYDNGQNDGNLVGDILLTQNSYNDYTINIVDTLEQWLPDIARADAFRLDIPINLKSSDFYINASWPTSTADGYFKVYYDDGTFYNVPQTTFSSGLFVYDGSSVNSDKYIIKISFQIVYDVIDSINITTSPNVIYYNNGYNEGYDTGFSSGVTTGQTNGFKNGYNNGYQIGYNEGATKDLTTNGFQTLLNSILSYPVNLISRVFNFEFMGINIASTLFFLISCGIVLWIIKRLWK